MSVKGKKFRNSNFWNENGKFKQSVTSKFGRNVEKKVEIVQQQKFSLFFAKWKIEKVSIKKLYFSKHVEIAIKD